MQSEELKELFLGVHVLFGEIAIFKLQERTELGFNLKVEFDKVNRRLERNNKAINRYADITYSKEVDKPQKELTTLIKTLSAVIDLLEQVPQKAQTERYLDIKAQSEELIQEIGQYNVLIEPSYDELSI